MTSYEPEVPSVHVVTDDHVLERDDWLRDATSVLEAGGSSIALHVRGRRTHGATLFRLATTLLRESQRTRGWIVVNDRVDVGLACGAGAIHLGSRSLPIDVVRGLVDEGTRIGVSCHARDDVARARSGGADYAFVGTVFSSSTHPDESGIGVEGLKDASRGSGLWPVIGIGGIDVARAGSVTASGGYGVAAISGVWSTENPAEAVAAYIEAVSAHVGG